MAPIDLHANSLELVNISLCDKRCDRDKALERKSLPWIMGAGPNHSHRCPYKREVERTLGQAHRRGEGNVMQPQTKECQEPPDTGRGMEKTNCSSEPRDSGSESRHRKVMKMDEAWRSDMRYKRKDVYMLIIPEVLVMQLFEAIK